MQLSVLDRQGFIVCRAAAVFVSSLNQSVNINIYTVAPYVASQSQAHET